MVITAGVLGYGGGVWSTDECGVEDGGAGTC